MIYLSLVSWNLSIVNLLSSGGIGIIFFRELIKSYLVKFEGELYKTKELNWIWAALT